MKIISLLGSTGSIGTNTLDVVGSNPDKFKIFALTAHSNIELLEQQIHKFKPKVAVVTDCQKGLILKKRLENSDTEILIGDESLKEVVSANEVNLVVNALVGISGLMPTYHAINNHKNIALANKETLVAGGELITTLAKDKGVSILPIDSEHSAIFQCIQGDKNTEKIILTASGGPFRGKKSSDLVSITPAQALKHPRWTMGKKISIDSATLMNKGLEVIEARWLFDIPYDNIDVIIHPQSIIHSMVEYRDGSIIAQLGVTDMRGPIQYALTYPERYNLNLKLDLAQIGSLTFEKPDYNTFRALGLAYRAGRAGGTMTTVLNSANEALVDLFLKGRIKFTDIVQETENIMDNHNSISNPTIEDIINIDREIRLRISKKFL